MSVYDELMKEGRLKRGQKPTKATYRAARQAMEAEAARKAMEAKKAARENNPPPTEKEKTLASVLSEPPSPARPKGYTIKPGEVRPLPHGETVGSHPSSAPKRRGDASTEYEGPSLREKLAYLAEIAGGPMSKKIASKARRDRAAVAYKRSQQQIVTGLMRQGEDPP